MCGPIDGDTGNLFAVQDEITSRIAVTLDLELVGAEAARATEHPDALDYILRGRAARLKPPSRENRAEAIGWFERALALDPQSVEAQSRLATSLAARVLVNMTDTAAADILRAERLAGQALAASPRDPLAHFAEGQVLRAQGRPEEAIPEYETALASDHNWVNAYNALAYCKLYTGSIDGVIPLVERAIHLSPREPEIGNCSFRIGQVHMVQSRTDEAIVWFEKARSANPRHPQYHAYLASAYALKGASERAADELVEAQTLSGDDRYSSIARLRSAAVYLGVPEALALFENTFFAGLRKAGMPEE
jgi:adenylate cyclase